MAVSNRTQQSQVVNNELFTKQLRQREKGRVTFEKLMEREERPKARQDARMEAHMINKLRVTKAESERRRAFFLLALSLAMCRRRRRRCCCCGCGCCCCCCCIPGMDLRQGCALLLFA